MIPHFLRTGNYWLQPLLTMNYRTVAVLFAGILTSVRVFDPTLLENSTDFVFHAAQVFDVSFLDVRSSTQTQVVFYAIIIAELSCALYLMSEGPGPSAQRVALGLWGGVLIFQVAANAYSWIGALESNCGVGLFRDDPRLIAAVHVAVGVALAVGAGGWSRR